MHSSDLRKDAPAAGEVEAVSPSPAGGDEKVTKEATSPKSNWKQTWLAEADRRGAIWHAQWKAALQQRRNAAPAGKRSKT